MLLPIFPCLEPFLFRSIGIAFKTFNYLLFFKGNGFQAFPFSGCENAVSEGAVVGGVATLVSESRKRKLFNLV
jgi:hypothetical protein